MQRVELIEAFGLDHEGVDYILDVILDEMDHLLDLQRMLFLISVRDRALTPARSQ